MAITASNCVPVVKAEVIRVTRLDACGIPVSGSGARQAVFDGFTEVQNSPQYEDGQRYLQKKANGAPCVNQKDPSFMNWIEQTVTLCTIDPLVYGLVSGMFAPTSATSGTGFAQDDGLLSRHFSLELWTPVAGVGACSSAGVQQYTWWAFPNMFDVKLQDFTFQNDVFTLSWQAITAPMYNADNTGNNWMQKMQLAGLANTEILAYAGQLYNTVIAGPQSDGVHFLFNVTGTAPPTAYCGAQSLPAA